MNFCIFNSNTIAMVAAFSLTMLTLFASANLALRGYVASRTSEQSFVQEIGSKAKHMALNNPTNGFDIIFIGNSRTEYGISTAEFLGHNLKAYNYGVAGSEIANYTSMLHTAVKLYPHLVIISIPPDVLYSHELMMNHSMQFNDVVSIWRAPFSLKEKALAFRFWLAGLNATRVYADQIYERIRATYQRFSNRSVAADSMAPRLKPVEDNFDCTIIKKTRLANGVTSYKCTDGNFIMAGVAQPRKSNGDVRLNNPDPGKIALLKALSEYGRDNGVRVAFVLEPAPATRYVFDMDALNQELDARVLNYANLFIPAEMWADTVHLNSVGRIYYSKILAKDLSALLSE